MYDSSGGWCTLRWEAEALLLLLGSCQEREQDETEELDKSCSFVSLPQPMGSSTSQIGTAMNDWVLEGANRHKASYTENKNLLEKKISI